MSLLDQLWDDTVAGPRPENGLGKLRKYPTFSFRSSSGKEIPEAEGVMVRSYGDDAAAERIRVTRSITIVKPQGNPNGSPPISPASSSPPVSPFGGGKEPYRFRRRSTSDAYQKASRVGPRSPPPPHDV
ncbi:dormancy-associated protein homolog 3-like isoform X2 [Cornus florida]|uniref:dormancy-associated protein homolog 3-like isoform X2 n=1 Tax=Cornus florida TaxID=4283 RepID=UPI00289CBC54|nr:dormancy-associated protein homolog 3-like isoform X2 [Cornus florida]